MNLNHPHRKKWGQNFIKDPNIIKKIIQVVNPNKDDKIIEIGPGAGALTKPLERSAKELVVIEIDPLLCSSLNQAYNRKINIINDDVLNIDFNNFKNYNKIVGNLPYYITTPIIFKVLDCMFCEKIIFMIQKEVAERIIADPGSKVYGRLSVMVQALSKVEKKFDISKNIFYPKPKVDSSLIELNIKKNNSIKNQILFSKVVKNTFGKRRKMLKNSLKDLIPLKAYDEYKNKRPEELSVDDYIKISNNI